MALSLLELPEIGKSPRNIGGYVDLEDFFKPNGNGNSNSVDVKPVSMPTYKLLTEPVSMPVYNISLIPEVLFEYPLSLILNLKGILQLAPRLVFRVILQRQKL